MTKTPVTEKAIKQLELDIANLELTVADKKQHLAELKLEQTNDESQSAGAVAVRSSPPRSTRRFTPSPEGVKSFKPKTKYSSPQRIDSGSTTSYQRENTGLVDCDSVPIFIGDIVELNSNSSGQFALRRQYRKGHHIEVYGVTNDNFLKIRVLNKPSVNPTTRSPLNVRKIIN